MKTSGPGGGPAHSVILKYSTSLMYVVTCWLPGGALAVCFFTALLFRFEQVTKINETACKVPSCVPSTSAVIGSTPGAYIWRIAVGLHSAPRFAMNIMYYNHYIGRASNLSSKTRIYKYLIRANYWIHFIEVSSALLVSNISHKENYPLHEKGFISFLVSALLYMMLNTVLFGWSRGEIWTETDQQSYWWKKAMLAMTLAATLLVLVCFVLHEFYCIPGAFNIFAASEYVILYGNIFYHGTGIFDFKEEDLLVASLVPHSSSLGSNREISPAGEYSTSNGVKPPSGGELNNNVGHPVGTLVKGENSNAEHLRGVKGSPFKESYSIVGDLKLTDGASFKERYNNAGDLNAVDESPGKEPYSIVGDLKAADGSPFQEPYSIVGHLKAADGLCEKKEPCDIAGRGENTPMESHDQNSANRHGGSHAGQLVHAERSDMNAPRMNSCMENGLPQAQTESDIRHRKNALDPKHINK